MGPDQIALNGAVGYGSTLVLHALNLLLREKLCQATPGPAENIFASSVTFSDKLLHNQAPYLNSQKSF